MCQLHRALYGHPEAGAHWEHHLTVIVKEIWGIPMESHPSSFWFAELQPLLTLYVDDLMLTGPVANHSTFWASLRKQFETEDPEPLDRLLGRYQEFPASSGPDHNFISYFDPADNATKEPASSE